MKKKKIKWLSLLYFTVIINIYAINDTKTEKLTNSNLPFAINTMANTKETKTILNNSNNITAYFPAVKITASIIGASIDGFPTASDSDGDGVNDICDLDDDNDGILDTNIVPSAATLNTQQNLAAPLAFACDVSNFEVTVTNGTCFANGSILITIPDYTDCSGWNAVLTPPAGEEVSTNVAANGTANFNSLAAGNYTVRLVNGADIVYYNNKTETTQTPITVTTSYVNMQVTSTATAPSCPPGAANVSSDATLTVTVAANTGTGPFLFEATGLPSITISPVAGTATSHTFTGIAGGASIDFSVTDQPANSGCTVKTGQTKVIPNNNDPILVESDVYTAINKVGCPEDCDLYEVEFSVYNVPHILSTDPNKAMISINGAAAVQLNTNTNFGNFIKYSVELHGGDTYAVTFTNGCDTVTKTGNVPITYNTMQNIVFGQSSTTFLDCVPQYGISINPNEKYWCATTNTLDLEYQNPTTNTWEPVATNVAVGTAATVPVTKIGTYQFTLTDGCKTTTETVTVTQPSNGLDDIIISDYYTLRENTGSMLIKGNNVNSHMPDNISYPVTYVVTPKNASSVSYISTGPYNLAGTFQFSSYTGQIDVQELEFKNRTLRDLPPNTAFNVYFTDACNNTVTKTFTTRASTYTPEITVSTNCENSNTIAYNMNTSADVFQAGSARLYTNDGNGMPGTLLVDVTYATSVNNDAWKAQTYNNLPSGDYVIAITDITQWGTSISRGYGAATNLAETIDEPIYIHVNIPDYVDVTVAAQSAFCSDNKGFILADISDGTPVYPLIWELFSSSDTSTALQSYTANTAADAHATNYTFTDVPQGNYFVRVKSSTCYELDTNVTLDNNSQFAQQTAVATPAISCPSSSVTLSIPLDESIYTVTWTDENNTTVGTGNNIVISPTETTTYTANVDFEATFSCTDQSYTSNVTVAVTADLNTTLAVSDISICTTNTDASFTITNAQSNFTYEVLDENGASLVPQLIASGNDADLTMLIPAANLPSNTAAYTVYATNGNAGCSDALTDTINITVPENIDTDGDGILNACDLDDDNDGILDTDEGLLCVSSEILTSFGTETYLTNANDGAKTTSEVTITYAFTGVTTETIRTKNLDGTGQQGPLFLVQTIGDANSATPEATIDQTFSTDIPNVKFKLTDFDAGENVLVNVYDENNNLIDLSTETYNLNGSQVIQNGNTFSTASNAILILGDNVNSDGVGSVVFNFKGIKISRIFLSFDYMIPHGAASIRFTELNYCFEEDADGDNIPNHLDLDSDGDGCPDTIEANVPTVLKVGAVSNTDGTVTTSSNIANAVIDITQDPVGANGLANSLENVDTEDATTNYTSNYIDYALDKDTNVCGVAMITQVYRVDGDIPTLEDRWVEITNVDPNNIIAANAIKIAFFNDINNTGTPTYSPVTISQSLDPNTSVLIATTNSSATIPIGTPFTTTANLGFTDTNDALIVTRGTGTNAWNSRIDVLTNVKNNTSYVRIDEIETPNTTYTESEWVAFIDDNITTYTNPIDNPNNERHTHAPLISEISTANTEANIRPGLHKFGLTDRVTDPNNASNTIWSNGYPDRSRHVKISSNYNHNDVTLKKLSARKLEVINGSTLSVTDNLLVVTNNIVITTANDEIRLISSDNTNKAQLIQTHTTESQVTGDGKLLIDQDSKVPSKYRYNYLSSPVNTIGATTFSIEDVLKDGTTPLTSSSAITDITFVTGYDGDYTKSPIEIADYWIYNYTAASDGRSNWNHMYKSGDIKQTDGFILKGPGSENQNTNGQNYTFIGTPKDGLLKTTIASGESYLVGNPYASALSSKKFIEDNLNATTGSLYFWEHLGEQASSNGSEGHNYGGYIGGYASFNLSGGVVATTLTDINANDLLDGSPSLGNGVYHAPKPFIAIGQGFFIEGSDSSSGIDNIKFDNSQREYIQEGVNSYFFKGVNKESNTKTTAYQNTLPIIKLGMDYTNDDNLSLHRQLLISFKNNNSFEFEKGYDTEIFDAGTTDLYWKFPNDEAKYVITGVQSISDDLEVPLELLMSKDGEVTFNIDEWNAIYRDVYLIDKLTNTSYLLNNGSKTLSLSKGTYTNRFVLSFTDTTDTSALNLEDAILSEYTNIYADNKNSKIVISKNNNVDIDKVLLYDVLGKEISNWTIKEQKTTHILKMKKQIPTGIYIVKMNTNIGQIHKKVVIE